MNTTEASSPNRFFNSSTLEGRRNDIRKFLILFLVATFAAPSLSGFFAPAPARLEEAFLAEIKSIPEWQYYTGMAAGLGLMAGGLFGVYRLWNFKWDGAGYLTASLLVPLFMMLPIPQVFSAFGYYLESISSMVAGMLLFACWSNRDIFEPATESTPAVVSESTPPAGHTAS